MKGRVTAQKRALAALSGNSRLLKRALHQQRGVVRTLSPTFLQLSDSPAFSGQIDYSFLTSGKQEFRIAVVWSSGFDLSGRTLRGRASKHD
jgi:hypothetical protein